MEITPKQLDEWLEKYGHSRQWLANLFNVDTTTIGNWLTDTKRKIPKRHQARLRELMTDDAKKKNQITITVNEEDFQKIEKRAHSQNLLIHEHLKRLALLDAKKFSK